MSEKKLGRFDGGLQIAKESWTILKQDKEMMWFPLISSLTNILFIVAFFYVLFKTGSLSSVLGNSNEVNSNIIKYAVIFVYYIVSFFISYFFQAGIITIAHARFNGENLSFKDGFKGALNNIGKIFALSAISATVGMILSIISEKSKIVGKIVASLFGAAWNILTYFSLPSLVVGKTTVRDSFKDSASVIRKTWGETIVVTLGVGFFFSIVIFGGFVVAVGVAYMIGKVLPALIIAGLFIIFLVVMSIISSTLGTVFKLALYEYAKTGVIPNGFSSSIIKEAISTPKPEV